jgi:molecular chaperone HscB
VTIDYFEVFGLPPKLGIDTAALQARFYELSRQWHPDFQHGAAPEAQAAALERSALVNAAYRALKDPVARAEYLVRHQEGRGTKEGSAVRPEAPKELLAEMFEIQEALQDARTGGLDAGGREQLARERDRLVERMGQEEGRLAGELAVRWDGATPASRADVLGAIKRSLATRAYLRTVVDDLNGALEGDEAGAAGERHVAHHRH